MSESCCSIPAVEGDAARCPASGFEGKPVDWTTVAALTIGTVPPRQDFRLCRDPECEVVYYGSGGAVLRTGDIHVRPGFKTGSDGLVCYCFSHREADIARELAERGTTGIFDSIKREVQTGNCACEVRNPSGKCCLGEVRETIQRLERDPGVTA
jgi:hypothetical protein